MKRDVTPSSEFVRWPGGGGGGGGGEVTLTFLHRPPPPAKRTNSLDGLRGDATKTRSIRKNADNISYKNSTRVQQMMSVRSCFR